ncbi:hypothetical protein V5O48_001828 [Marasmius crinis-equi]|uniref:Uncharacterized protein n=1 Tax=Marasmius crinis-equi TaxID=585013 RepID=A0ABR3FX92_9AGAR
MAGGRDKRDLSVLPFGALGESWSSYMGMYTYFLDFFRRATSIGSLEPKTSTLGSPEFLVWICSLGSDEGDLDLRWEPVSLPGQGSDNGREEGLASEVTEGVVDDTTSGFGGEVGVMGEFSEGMDAAGGS